MENTVAELKRKILDCLCRESKIEVAMNEVLEMVGKYFNVDRAYVFENSKDNLCCSNTFEWCNEGIEPEINNLQNLRYLEDLGGTWQDNFNQDDIFICRDISELPRKQLNILRPQKIFSMLQCAVRVRGKFKGYIGFDNCSKHMKGWETDADAIDTLIYTSHLISLYLLDYRQKTEQIEKNEQKMREQINYANTMFDDLLRNVNCGVAIYHVKLNGDIKLEYVNDGLIELLNGSKEELFRAFNRRMYFTVDDEFKSIVAATFDSVVENSNVATVIYRATTFSGKHIWITAKFSGSKKEDGTTMVYATFFDTTSETENSIELQRRYEVEKRRSQNDSSVLAYAVFNLNNGQTVEMERRAPLLYIGKRISMEEFKQDIYSCIISKEQCEKFDKLFNADYLLEKYREGTDEVSVEFQRQLPNGKVIWVKSSFHLMQEPSGNDVLLFYYCNDINLRKSLEIMTTYMANEDYDMLGCINFRDDSAIMMYGKNSAYEMKTGEKRIRREERYTESMHWFVDNAIVPEEREIYRTGAFIDKIKAALSRDENYEFTVHINDKLGRRLTKKIRYTRYDKESEICFFTQIDITDMLAEEEKKQNILKNALELAKQANESKTEFFSRMSHDMRTPMNGILGLAELSEDEEDVNVLKSNISKIKSSGEYLLGLINDTLDFQKIESGKLTLEPEVVNGNDILKNVEEMLKPSMEKKNIDFIIKKENIDLDYLMYVDPIRIKQIFINIISNAIKFTPENGKIEVEMECMGQEKSTSKDRFIIRDTGIGMSEDFIKNKIFKPFSQEHNTVTGIYAGSGLGLSIVKSLIELMGGSISVESEQGVGTTFVIELSLEMVSPEEAEKALKKRTIRQKNVGKNLKDKRILLAEDHPLNAEIAIKLLEKVHCKVDWAKDGKECVDIFEASKENYYDAILMDVRMPLIDGIEATKKIRHINRDDAARIPIIAMTANAYDEDVKKCMEAGMNAHIAKPIQPAVMYETIANAIEFDIITNGN